MEKTYNVSEAAEKIGVSVKTLQRWDRDGKLVANRTPSNRRYYTEKQLSDILNVEENKMREKFMVIAERFIEYLKDGDFTVSFDFVMSDGTNNFDFGTIAPHGGFGNWLFVTSMYGDGSGSSASLLVIEDVNDIEDSWDDYLDYITDYYFEHYKNWTPVI